jgi:hypothetical protein
MKTLKSTDRAFLVKVDADRCVQRIDGREIVVSTVPSICELLTYIEADAVARELRRRKFVGAYVADVTGSPVTAQMLSQDFAVATALPSSLRELYQIPVAEQRRRYASEPSFKRRVDELEVQS